MNTTPRFIARARHLLPAIALTLATLLPMPAVGQIETAAESPVVNADGLNVTLGIEKTTLELGEPLVLVTTIEGKPDLPAPVQFNSRLQLSEGNDIEVFVQAPGEVEKRAQGAQEVAIYSALILEVPPDQTYQHTQPLLYESENPEGYLFNSAGQYRLRAQLTFASRYRGNTHQAQLGPLTINVVAPVGPAAQAYAQLANPEAAKALEKGTTSDKDLIAKLRQVGEQYPQTVQGREALRTAALSEAYGEGSDMTKAIVTLKRYHDLYPLERGSDLIAYTIASGYTNLQQTHLARHWYYYFLDEYPTSTLIRRQDQMYQYYLSNPREVANDGPWYLTAEPWVVPAANLPKPFQPAGM